MRRPLPPSCTLAASGEVIVWEGERTTGLIDLQRSGEHPVDIDDVGVVAVSPRAEIIAVATSERLVMLARDSGWTAQSEHPLDGSLFRLAVHDTGVAIGVTAHDDDSDAQLVLADHDRLVTHPIGPVVAFTLLLDAPRRRVLVAGQEGRGAFHGGGKPFVRLIEWNAALTTWTTLWDGPPEVEPNGWVMPLSFGDIGVHDLDRLVVISPDTHPDDVGAIDAEHQLEHLETVVASPDGGHVAWWWTDSSDSAVAHVRTLRLADGTVGAHHDVDGVDQFVVMAVDDDGTVTLVDSVGPATVRVRKLEAGEVDTKLFEVGA